MEVDDVDDGCIDVAFEDKGWDDGLADIDDDDGLSMVAFRWPD